MDGEKVLRTVDGVLDGVFKGSTKKLYSEDLSVVCCWVAFSGVSGAPLGSLFLRICRVYWDWASNRILFFRNLSGIFHFAFRQDLIIKEASGDLSKLGGASVL